MQTTYLNGQYEEQGFDEIYEMTGTSIIIKLQQADGRRGLKTHHRVQLNKLKKALIEFSNSGRWFAVYSKHDKIINVFDSTDIHKCF